MLDTVFFTKKNIKSETHQTQQNSSTPTLQSTDTGRFFSPSIFHLPLEAVFDHPASPGHRWTPCGGRFGPLNQIFPKNQYIYSTQHQQVLVIMIIYRIIILVVLGPCSWVIYFFFHKGLPQDLHSRQPPLKDSKFWSGLDGFFVWGWVFETKNALYQDDVSTFHKRKFLQNTQIIREIEVSLSFPMFLCCDSICSCFSFHFSSSSFHNA